MCCFCCLCVCGPLGFLGFAKLVSRSPSTYVAFEYAIECMYYVACDVSDRLIFNQTFKGLSSKDSRLLNL